MSAPNPELVILAQILASRSRPAVDLADITEVADVLSMRRSDEAQGYRLEVANTTSSIVANGAQLALLDQSLMDLHTKVDRVEQKINAIGQILVSIDGKLP